MNTALGLGLHGLTSKIKKLIRRARVEEEAEDEAVELAVREVVHGGERMPGVVVFCAEHLLSHSVSGPRR